MNINDFKTLLLNRSEIEKILGRAITAESSGDDYLDDYRLFPELSLHDVTCLLLGLHPKDWEDWDAYQNHRYEVIKEAIQQSAKSGHIQARIEKGPYGNVGNIFLTHEVAEKWAKTHGLKWNIPPYRKPSEDAEGNNQAIELENLSKPVIDSTELLEEKAKNAQLQAEIERLKAENAELKAQLQDNAQRQSAVDFEPVLGNAKATRISQPQRDIFSLLVAKNYQGQPSRNSLFDAINADLEATGISNKSVSYQTFDNLIDEALRLTKTSLDGNQIQYSPFPSKITK